MACLCPTHFAAFTFLTHMDGGGLQGATAAFVINTDPDNSYSSAFTLATVNASAIVSVRDIWERKDLGRATGSVKFTVPAYDSVFFVLTPSS